MSAPAPRTTPAWLPWAAIMCAGVGVRVVFFAICGGIHHPDEIFQYLEPAYWRIHGDAWLAWEFERGARNWVLPAFWGAWIEVGEFLGLHGWALQRWLALHSALISLALIPAGYRLGRAAWPGDDRLGWAVALACAVFPVFGYFAPHTLSEGPGVVLTTWACALWLEGAAEPHRPRRAFLLGLLLGAAFIARYSLAIFAVVPLVDIAARRRYQPLLATLTGVGVAASALVIVDALTWGSPLHSVCEFLRANRWAISGTGGLDRPSTAVEYLLAGWRHLGPGIVVLVAASLGVVRRQWRLLLAWLVPVVLLTSLANRQERFLLSIWPLFIANGLAGIANLADRMRRRAEHAAGVTRGSSGGAVVIVSTVLIATLALYSAMGWPVRFLSGMFRAQDWVGRQPDLSGVLLDGGQNANGGYLLLSRSVPLLPYEPALARHALFNYIIAFKPPLVAQLRRRADFDAVASFDDAVVFHRRVDLRPIEGAGGCRFSGGRCRR